MGKSQGLGDGLDRHFSLHAGRSDSYKCLDGWRGVRDGQLTLVQFMGGTRHPIAPHPHSDLAPAGIQLHLRHIAGCVADPHSWRGHADTFGNGLTGERRCSLFVHMSKPMPTALSTESAIAETVSDAVAPCDPTRPDITSKVTRGVARFLRHQGCAVITEFTLANGRRADVVGICPKGFFTIVEVKSCRADFDVDEKWQDYLDYCDQFFFAVDEAFPVDILPSTEGLIIADGFGGGIVRPSVDRKLVAARRKAVTLRFARQAAFAAMDRQLST